jgi:hypothetical protein
LPDPIHREADRLSGGGEGAGPLWEMAPPVKRVRSGWRFDEIVPPGSRGRIPQMSDLWKTLEIVPVVFAPVVCRGHCE